MYDRVPCDEQTCCHGNGLMPRIRPSDARAKQLEARERDDI